MDTPFDAKFGFAADRRYCLGVEEEIWTVSPKTGVLVSGAPLVFAKGEEVPSGFKPELPAQQIEMVTPVCRTLAELDAAVAENDRALRRLAAKHRFALSRDPVPTKPFAIEVFPTERYQRIQAQFGERLRGAYVAGLHVHVGLGSKEEAVAAMNGVRLHLPAFLAISARSPYKEGRASYRSYRYLKYKEMAGDTVPPFLQSWTHFGLVAGSHGFAEDPRMCWWALRISPHGTIELRVCDVQAERKRTIGIAALFRMLVRISVEGPEPKEKISATSVADRLLMAAKGRFDTAGYLARAAKIAELPTFVEERPHIRKLLG